MTERHVLYVVGNGFDLHHGLPTDFRDFRDYVHTHAPKVAKLVEQWLPGAGETWGALESALGEFDEDLLVQEASTYLQSYGDDDWSDASHFAFQEAIEAVVEPLSEELSALFRDWVERVPVLTREAASGRRLRLREDGLFLSFNYTPTLESAYGVPLDRVWHVHGLAGTGMPLILGHGYKRHPLRILPANESEEDPIGDPREAQGFELIDDYFRSTFKPAKEIIAGLPEFFANLGQVQQVWVLGHSIAEVDQEYYKAIIAAAPKLASWGVSYYLPSEEEERVAALMALGVQRERITTFTLEAFGGQLGLAFAESHHQRTRDGGC